MAQLPDDAGAVYFDSSSFNTTVGWCDSRTTDFINEPALIPPMPWLESVKPHEPKSYRNNHKRIHGTAWTSKGVAEIHSRVYTTFTSNTFIPYQTHTTPK